MKGAQRYWRLRRSVTLGAQAVVFDDLKRVLLVRHGYRPGWHFPGGGVEKSESVETAIRRELVEETGVEIIGRPDFFGLYTNFKQFPSDHVALFLVPQYRQLAEPPTGWEIRERGFFELERLPTGVTGAVTRRLAELKSVGTRSTEW